MNKPSVDILLPYWGDFTLLQKTVSSILAQTNTDWHLSIFDDCYPSHEAQDYFRQLKDARITYHRHQKNIGITHNFNYALDSASSKYFVMIGCDDIMLPHYIETALKNIGDADFYQPGVEIIDERDQSYLPLVDRVKRFLQPKKSGIYEGESLAASLCRGNWLYFPSIMWKTSVVKKYRFNPKYKIAEDLQLELSMIKDGRHLSYDTTVSFQYRRFAQSLSSKEKSKGGVRFGEEIDVYTKFSKEFSAIGWKKAARAAKLRLTSRAHELIS